MKGLDVNFPIPQLLGSAVNLLLHLEAPRGAVHALSAQGLCSLKLPAKPPICPLVSGRLSQGCTVPPYVRYSLLNQLFNPENKDQVFTLKIFVIEADKRQTCIQRYLKLKLITLEGYGSHQSSCFFYEDFFDRLSPKWDGNLFQPRLCNYHRPLVGSGKC